MKKSQINPILTIRLDKSINNINARQIKQFITRRNLIHKKVFLFFSLCNNSNKQNLKKWFNYSSLFYYSFRTVNELKL